MRTLKQIAFGVFVILGIPLIVMLIFALAGFLTQPGGFAR
jgi:hypothetical protein